MAEDIYYKKTIVFNFWKHSLKFKTSQEIFSSHDIDLGTQFLLRTIVEAGYPVPGSILDLGCGYGPLGLTLKGLHPESRVHLVDRDALAVDYTRQNIELNGLSGAEAYGSLGYDDVARGDFDLIVSNIPGKAGETVLPYLLREAVYYLAPGGMVAIVVVTPLEGAVEKALAETPGLEITAQRARPGHTVFHYLFSAAPGEQPGQSAVERGIYQRGEMEVRLDGLRFPMRTAYGLPEFDSLDYRSEMLLRSLQQTPGGDIRSAAVLNPGQGHAAAAVWKLFQPEQMVLADRDLLALRYSRLNLLANGCPADRIISRHQAGMDGASGRKLDLATAVLREEEGPEAAARTILEAAAQLKPGGKLYVAAGSTAISRLIDRLEPLKLLKMQSRERWRNFSLLAAEKK